MQAPDPLEYRDLAETADILSALDQAGVGRSLPDVGEFSLPEHESEGSQWEHTTL